MRVTKHNLNGPTVGVKPARNRHTHEDKVKLNQSMGKLTRD